MVRVINIPTNAIGFHFEKVGNHKVDLTKKFLHANKEEQEKILRGMKLEEKEVLLSCLREHFRTAGNEESVTSCKAAVLLVSINIIKNMPVPGRETDPAKIYTINILKFMNSYVKYNEEVPHEQKKNRDASEWSGERSLAEGNFNGCVEAARIFLSLLRGVNPNIRSNFLSSFSKQGAIKINEELRKPPNLQNKELLRDPPGHAVIEVRDGKGNPFLVDAAMLRLPLLGRSITSEDLKETYDIGNRKVKGIVLQYPGQCDLWIRMEGSNLKITQFPHRQFGRNGREKSFRNLDELNMYIKKYDKSPSFTDLEYEKIILHEKDGSFEKDAGEYSGIYIIFNESPECPFTSQYGPNGSSSTTLEAIKKWRH